MPLTVTTDPAQIVARLDRLLAAPEAWCAVRQGTDALVVRSHRQFPALFTSGWDGPDLDAAIALVRQPSR